MDSQLSESAFRLWSAIWLRWRFNLSIAAIARTLHCGVASPLAPVALLPLSIQPPHAANRDDAGGIGLGDCGCVVILACGRTDRVMKYRKLRIAWSVAWGIACLLVIACGCGVTPSPISSFTTTRLATIWRWAQIAALFRRSLVFANWIFVTGLLVATPKSAGNTQPDAYDDNDNRGIMDFRSTADQTELRVPYYLLIMVTVAFEPPLGSPVPRFSLRALLVRTTLVAIGLGLAVYVAR